MRLNAFTRQRAQRLLIGLNESERKQAQVFRKASRPFAKAWQFTVASKNHADDAAPGFNAFVTLQTKRTTAPVANPAVNYLRIEPSRVSCETIGLRLLKSSAKD